MTAIAAAEKKRKRDEMYYRFNINRGMGYIKNRLRKYDDAVGLFTNAIENAEPGFETPLIIARSKAHSKRVDHEAARRDALHINDNYPDEIRGLENDAYTLYEKDDFEDSLVRSYCGFRKRKKPDNFFKGILVGKETIEDCIGRNAGPCLEQDRLGHVIVEMHSKKHTEPPRTDELTVARRNHQKEKTDRLLASIYLRRLAADKKFLIDVLKIPEIKTGNKEHSEQLQALLSKMIAVINRQQETLMTQRPMYMLEHHKPKFSEKYLEQKQKEDEKSREGVMNIIDKLYAEGENHQKNRKLGDCMYTCDRIRRFVECTPSNLLPNKQRFEVLDKIYSLIGLAYMDTKTIVPDWSNNDNELRIEFILKSNIKNQRFIDRARETYFPQIWNVQELRRGLENRLHVSIHKMERMYLYHELSRCLFEEQNLEKAFKMATASFNMAKDNPVKYGVWQFNAGFLRALSVLMEGETDDAKVSFTEVMINARKMERDDVASFIQKVIKISTEPNRLNYDPPDPLQEREKELMDNMSTPELRINAHRIIQRIKVAPRNARLKLKTPQATKTVGAGASGTRRSIKMAARVKRRTLFEVKNLRKQTETWDKSSDDLELGNFD